MFIISRNSKRNMAGEIAKLESLQTAFLDAADDISALVRRSKETTNLSGTALIVQMAKDVAQVVKPVKVRRWLKTVDNLVSLLPEEKVTIAIVQGTLMKLESSLNTMTHEILYEFAEQDTFTVLARLLEGIIRRIAVMSN